MDVVRSLREEIEAARPFVAFGMRNLQYGKATIPRSHVYYGFASKVQARQRALRTRLPCGRGTFSWGHDAIAKINGMPPVVRSDLVC
jgi:hypothetical protein